MGEHVGQVFDPLARLLLDPRGRCPVTGGAGGARDLRVADVPHEHVPEAVLRLALHRARCGRGARAPCGRARAAPARPRAGRGRPSRRARPPRTPCPGRRRPGAGSSAPARACRDGRRSAPAPSPARPRPRPARPGPRAGARTPPRRAGCRRRARAASCCVSAGSTARSSSEPMRRAVSSLGERGRLIRCAFRAFAPKPGMPLVQLGPGGAEEEQRHALRPVGQVLEEGEERLVGPVQVLEDEHRLPPLRPRLEHAAPGGERLLLRGGLAADADERREAGLEPGEVGIVRGQRLARASPPPHRASRSRGSRTRPSRSRPAPRRRSRPRREGSGPGASGRAPGAPRRRRRAPRRGGSCRRPARPRSSRAGRSAAAPARSKVPMRSDFSSSRPTSGVVCVRVTSVPKRARGCERAEERERLGLALDRDRLELLVVEDALGRAVRRLRDRDRRSTGAAPCRREAVLTTSPVTIPSPSSGRAPSATTASPVLIPMRTCSASAGSCAFSSAIASRMRRPALTARSASSSCATGAPKTAMTASPMNFSTVPP